MRQMVLCLLFLLAGTANAHELRFGPIRITHPWAHASPSGASAVPVHMKIILDSGAPDRLIGGSSPVARAVEIHAHASEGAPMQILQQAELKQNQPIQFSQGNLRLIFLDVKVPLQEFETFPLTLIFEKAGPLTMDVSIEEADSEAPKEDYGL